MASTDSISRPGPGEAADARPAGGGTAGRVSIGAYLRHQRQLRGISLEGLSELTRIPLRSLERLEGGQFDSDVDGFVRGFVRTVAQALGLDPGDTVARMLEEPQGGAGESSARRARLRLLALAGGVAALLVLLLVLGRLLAGLVGGSGESEQAVDGLYRVDAVRVLAEVASAEATELTAASTQAAPPQAAEGSQSP